VSHRLDEVFAITDALTVLRDGRVAGRWRTADADIPTITRAMVGQLADEHPRMAREVEQRPVAIKIKSSPPGTPGVPELDLSLYAGEVLGLAGLEGPACRLSLKCSAGPLQFHA
jgi:ABC-type sugar transport system ATPase subunit